MCTLHVFRTNNIVHKFIQEITIQDNNISFPDLDDSMICKEDMSSTYIKHRKHKHVDTESWCQRKGYAFTTSLPGKAIGVPLNDVSILLPTVFADNVFRNRIGHKKKHTKKKYLERNNYNNVSHKNFQNFYIK